MNVTNYKRTETTYRQIKVSMTTHVHVTTACIVHV